MREPRKGIARTHGGAPREPIRRGLANRCWRRTAQYQKWRSSPEKQSCDTSPERSGLPDSRESARHKSGTSARVGPTIIEPIAPGRHRLCRRLCRCPCVTLCPCGQPCLHPGVTRPCRRLWRRPCRRPLASRPEEADLRKPAGSGEVALRKPAGSGEVDLREPRCPCCPRKPAEEADLREPRCHSQDTTRHHSQGIPGSGTRGLASAEGHLAPGLGAHSISTRMPSSGKFTGSYIIGVPWRQQRFAGVP